MNDNLTVLKKKKVGGFRLLARQPRDGILLRAACGGQNMMKKMTLYIH